MKGKPMKEKIIFALSLSCFIGVMWLSSTTTNTTKLNHLISEKSAPFINNYLPEYIDNEPSNTIHVNDSAHESNFPVMNACSFKPIQTDVFTFGNAFKHYRECLGSNNSFQWRGNTYTTLLSEEIIIQIADSTQLQEKKRNNHEVSETH